MESRLALDPGILIALLIIGLLAGGVGGLLGVGGSIVMIPAMTEVLGPDQHVYQAAAMIVNFFVVVPAVVRHRQAGAIDIATVRRLIPLALAAVLIGVAMSELPIFAGENERYLRKLFGVFLMILAGGELLNLARSKGKPTTLTDDVNHQTRPETTPFGWVRAAQVALPTGIIAGLFGVGGGVLAVPLQRRFLDVPIRNAIANSASVIIATSVVGATAKNWSVIAEGGGVGPLFIAGALAPTAVIGSLFGSRLTHILPVKIVKSGFLLLLLVAAIRMIYR